ncbi:MAG: GTP-binding protein EngB [Candidatus Hodarchaeota archaeon]
MSSSEFFRLHDDLSRAVFLQLSSPIEKHPIMVIVGRSNTGKSSLCRLLAPWHKRKIKVGKNPGVTKKPVRIMMDDYEIVDLPGFGYMKGVSKREEERVMDDIINFIESNREEIFVAVQVIDLTAFKRIFEKYKSTSVPFDKELFEFLQEMRIPTMILANKVDKLRKNEMMENFNYLKEGMETSRFPSFSDEDLIQCSMKTKQGLDRILERIGIYQEKIN